jgi:hypothetical protein
MEIERPLVPAPVSRLLFGIILGSLLAVAAGFPLAQAVYEAAVLRERPHVLELFRKMPSKASLHAWDQAAKDRSLFGKAIRPAMLQGRYDLLGETGPKVLPGRDSWLFYRPDADYLLLPPFDDRRFYKDAYDTLVDGKWVNPRNPLIAIRHFRDQLAAQGVDLIMVPIPGKAAIYPERLGHGFKAPPPSPTLRFLGALRDAGIPAVDLHAALLRAKARGAGPLYLGGDTHWTPAGMEVAAEAVLEALRSRPAWIAAPDSMRRHYDSKPVRLERFGDIAEMTKIPRRRELFPLEEVEAKQVRDSRSKALYRDDPESPILWLGDSFSRIYQTDAPLGAGIIAHVAKGLGFPLASLVNDGGASTVVRQQLLRRPELLRGKTVVVWAFVERDIRFGDKGWMLLDLARQQAPER